MNRPVSAAHPSRRLPLAVIARADPRRVLHATSGTMLLLAFALSLGYPAEALVHDRLPSDESAPVSALPWGLDPRLAVQVHDTEADPIGTELPECSDAPSRD